MKKIITTLVLFSFVINAIADEGMWLPMLVKRLNEVDMQKAGCKLTAQEIYDVNNSSLKDNIVHLEFCTAELVSANGLMLTNHHCAMGGIQANTTIENKFLDNGFWSKSNADDLPIPNQTASVLKRMDDVTSEVLKGVSDTTNPASRKKIIDKNIAAIEEKAKENGMYRAFVRDMFAGNQYLLFVMIQYKDVRLVGFPPQSIGKFGGDTDNWMWPRHTGDFAMMRIYTAPDGKPAAYSKSNVSLKVKNNLKISLKGIKENDFAMIMGFPGRTNRYATSEILRVIYETENPAKIKLQGKILESWKTEMDKDIATRYKYAAKFASKSNGHKYAIGQNKGLKTLGIINEKKVGEVKFQTWSASNAETQKYSRVLGEYAKLVKENEKINKEIYYLQTAGKSSEAATFCSNLFSIYKYLLADSAKSKVDSLAKLALKKSVDFYKNYSATVDQRTFEALTKIYIEDIAFENLPSAVKELVDNNKLNTESALFKNINTLFIETNIIDSLKLRTFLTAPKKQLFEADKMFMYAYNLNTFYDKNLAPQRDSFDKESTTLKRIYMEGFLKMNAGKSLYPDANGTERFSYGKVKSYQGKDGYDIKWRTTTNGLIEKYDSTSNEFNLPPKLLKMIEAKQFGKYAENGIMPVAFLTTNDITGGNSGSPVLNDKGELIGLAFDGNWEAMTGDLVFDANYKRTICVDIRYVMWIIENYGEAKNIVSEFTFAY